MTVVSPAPFVRFKVCDNNNVPLTGGKLFTYQAGTTTKQASYTDPSGTTQNTNPVILDSRGECDLYLDASLNYKLVAAPATDTDPPTNPLWTRDNIPGIIRTVPSLAISPPSGTNAGLQITQTYTGTASGFNGNYIDVVDDSDIVGTNFSVPFYIQHNFGGSNATGGRSGMWIDCKNDFGPTSSSNANRNYVGITAQGWANSSDGGTGLTSATAKGAFFGIAGVGLANSGATNLLNVTGGELNTSVQAGSSVALKSILQLSGQGNDAVSGSVVDTMLWLYDQGGAGGHNDGVLFDASTTFGSQWPIKSTGNLIRTTGGSAANGIDISATTFSGSAFKSPGFSVNGNGTILSLAPVTVASLPAAGTAGRRAFVSDANATTFNSVVAGGGANKVPVFDNGTSWCIG